MWTERRAPWKRSKFRQVCFRWSFFIFLSFEWIAALKSLKEIFWLKYFFESVVPPTPITRILSHHHFNTLLKKKWSTSISFPMATSQAKRMLLISTFPQIYQLAKLSCLLEVATIFHIFMRTFRFLAMLQDLR